MVTMKVVAAWAGLAASSRPSVNARPTVNIAAQNTEPNMLLTSCLLSRLLHYCYNTCFTNENSEVSPVDFLVAVALTTCPLATFFLVLKVKVVLPLALVVTLFWPLNFWPSPKPLLHKNHNRGFLAGS